MVERKIVGKRDGQRQNDLEIEKLWRREGKRLRNRREGMEERKVEWDIDWERIIERGRNRTKMENRGNGMTKSSRKDITITFQTNDIKSI